MILYRSNNFQKPHEADYPIRCDVLATEELAEVVQWDHVAAEYLHNHRHKKNFVRSDCLMMDVDNSEADREVPPEEWIYPEDVRKAFPGVSVYISYSRNHMKDKPDQKLNGSARPRFHVYFDFANFVEDEAEYSAMKRRMQRLFPAFDKGAKDSARFFNGVKDPKVEYFAGDTCLDEWLHDHPEAGVEKKAPAPAPVYPEDLDRDELIDALYHVSAGCDNDTWVRIGMILKDEGFDVSVWDQWSQTCPDKYHSGECEKRWRSFHGSDKPVRPATIFQMAQKNGWRPAPKRSKALDWNSEIGDGDDDPMMMDWNDSIRIDSEPEKAATSDPPDDDPNIMGFDDVIRADSPSESDPHVEEITDKDHSAPVEAMAASTSETVSAVTSEAEATPPATSKAAPEVTPPKAAPVPDDFSELGLAEWFVAKHGDDYRYNDSHGVLHYNEATGCWEEDPHAIQMEVIRDLDYLRSVAKLKVDNANYNMEHCIVVDPIEHDKELTKFGDDLQYAEELEKFVKKMRSANRIKGVCDLVIPHIVISSDKLDSNPYVLNTPDGLVDLRTGKISPHSRAAYCTKCTKIGPSNVGMSTWYQFIDTVTVGDASLAGFLQLVVGMCLIGTTKIEKVIFLIGGGANGKSTFTGAIMNVLGGYATAVDSEVLMNTRKNVMPAMATLRGARFALASELAENKWVDVGQLKKLSSTDLITAERKYFAPESFKPSHTLILQSNYLPKITALDVGTWRRVLAIPFFAHIDVSEAIENYAEVLFEKAGGAILNWAVEGAVNFARNAYKLDPIPEAVEKTTSEYQTASNWIEIFLSECTDSDGDSPAHDVYQKYSQWALARGEHPRSETSFGTAMRAAGHGSEHTRSGSVYYGIKVSIDD